MGSIGSMVTVDKEFIKFFKANRTEIYSRDAPKKNQEFRELLKGKTKLLEDYVTEHDNLFMEEVREFRNLAEATAEDTLKGAMFFAEEAVERGLADGIKTFEQTIQFIASDVSKDSNNNNSFKINSNMEFKISSVTWKSIVENFNRITGKEVVSDAKPETLIESMVEVQSLKDFKNSVIAEATAAINTTVESLNEKVATLTDKVKQLEATNASKADADADLTENVKNLTTKVTTLEAANKTLTATNVDLVTQVATLKGTPVLDGVLGQVDRKDTAGVFSNRVLDIQTVGSDPKYSKGKKNETKE